MTNVMTAISLTRGKDRRLAQGDCGASTAVVLTLVERAELLGFLGRRSQNKRMPTIAAPATYGTAEPGTKRPFLARSHRPTAGYNSFCAQGLSAATMSLRGTTVYVA